jgi:hypothetical protein
MFGLNIDPVIVFFFFLVYLFPAISACARRHEQRWAITVLNIVGGWTVLGWIAALVWCFVRPNDKVTK